MYQYRNLSLFVIKIILANKRLRLIVDGRLSRFNINIKILYNLQSPRDDFLIDFDIFSRINCKVSSPFCPFWRQLSKKWLTVSNAIFFLLSKFFSEGDVIVTYSSSALFQPASLLELRGFDSSARSVWCEPNFFLPRRDLDRLHRLIALCVTLQRGVIVTQKNIIKNWSRNFDIIDNNAPVKGNPDPPHPGICGALSPYWQFFDSPVWGGFAHFVASILRGVLRDFFQDGDDRSRKDLWVPFGTLELTQVFPGICGIRFTIIQINTSINLGHYV